MTGETATIGFAPYRPKAFALTPDRVLQALIVLAILAVTAQRLWLSIGLPLWLDETWTAMIATQPTWASFGREAWLDCNAPLYYAVEKVWVSLAGDSNAALRLPSAVFYYAAAAVPLVWKDHGLDRRVALLWSTVILLWSPGIFITLDARAYGLLMLESMCGIIAFARAWRRGDSRAFLLWAAIASLQMLTHYFACFLVAFQGLFLLWRWRLELVKRAYAFLPLLVPVAWTLYHLSRLQDYARPDVVWYERTGFDTVAGYVVFTLGGWNPYFAFITILGLGIALWKSGGRLAGVEAIAERKDSADASTEGARMAFVAGGLALTTILVATAVLSSLTERYLIPVVPSMLLGMVMFAGRIPRSDLALPFMVAAYAVFALNPPGYAKELRSRSDYGYERQSDFVASARPTELVFVWDHPAAKILDRQSLAQIGEYFLERQDIPVRTKALILNERDDPNAAIKAAVERPGTAVIWLYNARRRSAAKLHPPVLAGEAGWRCRDDRRYLKKKNRKKQLEVGVLACITA